MLVLHRVALPFVNSLFITAVLFGLMYSLIHMEEPELLGSTILPPIKISNIPEETPVSPIVVKPKAPEIVDLPPELVRTIDIIDSGEIEQVDLGEYKLPVHGPGDSLPIDNQLVVAIGFPPEYPNRAMSRGIEGYAVVGFSVSAAGAVFDPHILEAQPKGYFERASLKAITKFKYRARKVNGRPVATDGQRYMFTYELD